MTQLKVVLLCALVHSFLRFEERIEIIRQNPKLWPIWYRSCLAPLPLFCSGQTSQVFAPSKAQKMG